MSGSSGDVRLLFRERLCLRYVYCRRMLSCPQSCTVHNLKDALIRENDVNSFENLASYAERLEKARTFQKNLNGGISARLWLDFRFRVKFFE